MPPFIPRKRRNSVTPQGTPSPKRAKKPSLFDTIDQEKPNGSIAENERFLAELEDGHEDTSLSDVGSSEFEDALPPSRGATSYHEEEDGGIAWEDAIHPEVSTYITPLSGPAGDLELTLHKDRRIGTLTNPHDKKKGPSKIERQIRTATHCMHVQFLLFHNLVRNAWTCDKELQQILVTQLPTKVIEEVQTWRRASGMNPSEEDRNSGLTKENLVPGSGRRGRKGKDRGGHAHDSPRGQRDWGRPAERQERGVPNMSRGDPIIRLLKYLAAYWKKRFRITAPGLRKQGYKSLDVLEEEVTSFRTQEHDPERHGERILGLNEFRQLARKCEGSRDVGAQLFTALIRGLGIEARLVASLQPIGFGWSKNEEAISKKKNKAPHTTVSKNRITTIGSETYIPDPTTNNCQKSRRKVGANTDVTRDSMMVKRPLKANGTSNGPVDLSEDSELSSIVSSESGEDDDSVIDITPAVPPRKPNMDYDKDLGFPNYWTEVISPLTHEIFPVDPLILIPPVASGQERLANFEPRGAKADKAKQVICYVIAYSSDATAKDVTTRYLKRHVWPGKTKGVRMPVEKIAVTNQRGKVKRHEEYDWFKTVMSGYSRNHRMRTAADDIEDEKDLKIVKPQTKDIKDGEETLHGYKQSAEYVLERHLRREEAILPASEPVKTFLAGKGENAKEEPVYRRKDVVVCRTGESWHKEGRQVKAGEYPMKMVPVRAVTLARKREVEEAERDGGEKMKQGLYAWDQTEWIIPPPIENGVIPKNAFGNMDCYVPTMVPKGAVHIPLRGTKKICNRLKIDFAEAVTGFEFGNQRAVPVITGVVVASEHEGLVIDEWEKDEEERRIKEEGKREKAALSMWRKFLMGLRIVERVQEEYGGDSDAHMKEEMNPFTNKNKTSKQPSSGSLDNPQSNCISTEPDSEELGGGFLVEDEEVDGGLRDPGMSSETIEDLKGRGYMLEKHSEAQPAPAATCGRDTKDMHIEFASPTYPYGSLSDQSITRKRGSNKRHTQTNGHSAINGESVSVEHISGKRSSKNSTKKSAIVGSKRHVPLESGSDFDGNSNLLMKNVSPKSKPKRQAARKSATALKSHYFAEEQSETEDGRNQNSTSEEDITSLHVARKSGVRKAFDGSDVAPVKAKRGRPRKKN